MSASKGKDAKMDWEAIHGLMEDAIYGGRIDNAYDLRVLRAYLRYTPLNPAVSSIDVKLMSDRCRCCNFLSALFSVFFSDRLAAEGSSGTEVLVGTPLRMPANPDFKSFAKMITQVLPRFALCLAFPAQFLMIFFCNFAA